MWKGDEIDAELKKAKENPTPENLDKASAHYYGLISQYSLRMESHHETIDLAIAALEELAGYENCTTAKKLIAQAKAQRRYRYTVKQITTMLESAKNYPSQDTKLAHEFYEYIGVPCGYIYYSNQHKRIVDALLSIYKSHREKLADIYLLILGAFLRTADNTEFLGTLEQKRELASDCYNEIISRKSPWTAEAFYQRGNMFEGSGNDEFRLSRYIAGYNHAVANKQNALAAKCLEQINRLTSRYTHIYDYMNREHLGTRAELHMLEIMGLIHNPTKIDECEHIMSERSEKHFRDLFERDDKTTLVQILSRLCEKYLTESTHPHHTRFQIFLLGSFIFRSCRFNNNVIVWKHGISASDATPAMKKFIYLINCGSNLENKTKNTKSVGEETPLQLLMNKPSINLREVFALFHQGAAKNTKNRDGDTLLHIATKNKWPDEAIELLLVAGLDPNVRNQDGNTVLHILASQRRQELIETLIKKYHANPAILDKNNQTAAQVLAQASNWWTIITSSLGFESAAPQPSVAAATPPPSFGSYDDVSAMKATAMAEYAKAKQDENRYANLPSVVRSFGNFFDSLDRTPRIPLQNVGGGMLVGRNTLPPLSVSPNSSLQSNPPPAPPLLPSEKVEESEEEKQQKLADAKRLAKVEEQSDADRLAKSEQRAATQEALKEDAQKTNSPGFA